MSTLTQADYARLAHILPPRYAAQAAALQDSAVPTLGPAKYRTASRLAGMFPAMSYPRPEYGTGVVFNLVAGHAGAQPSDAYYAEPDWAVSDAASDMADAVGNAVREALTGTPVDDQVGYWLGRFGPAVLIGDAHWHMRWADAPVLADGPLS